MTPLFVDDVHIAKLLLKTAVDSCLANKALPKMKLQLFHQLEKIVEKTLHSSCKN